MTDRQPPSREVDRPRNAVLVGVALFLITIAVLVFAALDAVGRSLDDDQIIGLLLVAVLVLAVVALVAWRWRHRAVLVVALAALLGPGALTVFGVDEVRAAAASVFSRQPAGLIAIDGPADATGPIVLTGSGDAEFELDLTAVTAAPAAMEIATVVTGSAPDDDSWLHTMVLLSPVTADGPTAIQYPNTGSVIVEARGPTHVDIDSNGAWTITITPGDQLAPLETGARATALRAETSGMWSVDVAEPMLCTVWESGERQGRVSNCPTDPTAVAAGSIVVVTVPDPGAAPLVTFTPDA